MASGNDNVGTVSASSSAGTEASGSANGFTLHCQMQWLPVSRSLDWVDGGGGNLLERGIVQLDSISRTVDVTGLAATCKLSLFKWPHSAQIFMQLDKWVLIAVQQ